MVAQDVRVSQEVLETGQDRPVRGAPAWLVWVAGAVALAAITIANVVVLAELTTRSVEAENLVRAVEQSENAMKSTQQDFDEVLSAYDAQNLTDEDREKLRGELADVAARGEVAIAEAGTGVADVQIMPWHSALLRAQESYLAHNQAWVDYMAAAAKDPGEWFRPQAAVDETFDAAKLPLVEAVPLLDPLGTLSRIETIYITGSGPGDDQFA